MSYDEYMKAKAAEAAEAKLEARAAEAFDMKGLKAAVKEEVAVSSSHTAFNIVPTRPLRCHCASPCRARAAQSGRSSSSLNLTYASHVSTQNVFSIEVSLRAPNHRIFPAYECL